MKRTRILYIGVLIFALFATSFRTPIALGSANPGVLPPQARIKGLSLADWTVREYKAWLEIPASQHPALGYPWSSCYLDHIGNVGLGVPYFESGSSECTLPAGMFLYVTVVGSECSNAEAPPFYGGNEEELRECALTFVPHNLQASVDGIPIKNIGDYTTLSPLYQLNLPDDNILGAPAGTYNSIAYSTGFILTPMSVGKHVVDVFGEIYLDGESIFTYNWTYNITVTKKK